MSKTRIFRVFSAIFLVSILLIFSVSASSPKNFFVNSVLSSSEENSVTEREVFSFSRVERQVSANKVFEEFKNSESGLVRLIVWLVPDSGVDSSVLVDSVISDFSLSESIIHEYSGFPGFYASVSLSDFEGLMVDSRVSLISPDLVMQGFLPQSVPLIQGDIAKSQHNLSGSGSSVCVLDSGVNYNHSDLDHSYVGGFDFVNSDSDPWDDNGHGTAVSGVIFSDNPFKTGVAPGAGLVAVKVLDNLGNGYSGNILAGLDYCVNNAEQFNIGVVSMSFGVGSFTSSSSPTFLDPLFQAAKDKGIVLVAASGNSGDTSGLAFPASSPYVLSVGAVYDEPLGNLTFSFQGNTCTDNVTVADQITCFTSRTQDLDLLAPGAMIYTMHVSGSYTNTWGTSLSAPFVAGTVALLKERNPSVHPDLVKKLLKNSNSLISDPITGLSFARLDSLDTIVNSPYLTKSGSLVPNGTIVFSYDSPLEAGQPFIFGLSHSDSPKINLGLGRFVPLASGEVLDVSLLYPVAVGLQDSWGTLDSNGHADITLVVPDIPGISNMTIVGAAVGLDANSSDVTSVSNFVQL